MHVPFNIFQTFRVLSPDAETSNLSTGEKATSQTPFLCPDRVY